MKAYTEWEDCNLCSISLASSKAPVVRGEISSPTGFGISDCIATAVLGQPPFPGKKQHLMHVWIGRHPTVHIRWEQQCQWHLLLSDPGFVLCQKVSHVRQQ